MMDLSRFASNLFICTCTYNLLVWKWIDKKFDIKWMNLLCFTFVDTAFLLYDSFAHTYVAIMKK